MAKILYQMANYNYQLCDEACPKNGTLMAKTLYDDK